MKNYDEIMEVLFHVEGKNLTPTRVNPVLTQFHEKLSAIRINSEPLRIFPERVDDLLIEEIDTSKLIGSYSIRWTITDTDSAGWGNRKDNSVRPLLVDAIRGFSIDNNQKYGKKIEAKIVGHRFYGEVRQGRWPRERMAVVTA